MTYERLLDESCSSFENLGRNANFFPQVQRQNHVALANTKTYKKRNSWVTVGWFDWNVDTRLEKSLKDFSVGLSYYGPVVFKFLYGLTMSKFIVIIDVL